jgi:hypothetical protein
MASKLVHAGFERYSGACRGFLEEQSKRFPRQQPVGDGPLLLGLQGGGQAQEVVDLRARHRCDVQQILGVAGLAV